MEPEIEKWGRENYPRLMENPRAIETLYRRKVQNQPVMTSQVSAYRLERLAELKPNEVVTVIVTKADVTVRELSVCKECNRSKCEHDVGRIPFYVVKMLAFDGSGQQYLEQIGTNKEIVDTAQGYEEFIATGQFKLNEKYGNEFGVKNMSPVSRRQLEAWDALQDVQTLKGGDAGISEEEFAEATKGKEELLAPFFDRVFISHQNGRVKW